MRVKLKDIATIVGGATPSTEHTEYYNGNIVWITPKDLADNKGKKYIDKGERNITKLGFQKSNTNMIPAYNILISTRAPIGYMAINVEECCTNQGFKSLICDKAKVNVDFLYYFLQTKIEALEKLGTGTTFKEVSKSAIEEFEVDLPDRKTQDEIAKILSGIDEQINRNNEVVKKLQVLSNTIYRQWFQLFNFPNKDGKPYKDSGGSLVWNDAISKYIPDGWCVKSLSELLRKNTIKFAQTSCVPTIDLSVMPSDSFALNSINSSDNFTTNLFEMNQGDLLFGSIRPYLHKAGIAPCNGAVAGTVHSYKCINDYDYNLSVSILTSDEVFSFAVKNSKGTKMPVIASDDLLSFKIPYSEEISKQFTNLLDIKNITCNCILQNQQLNNLKKQLLPLLINNQLKV